MTDEQRKNEESRLQDYKDRGLIHDFEIREEDVLVTIRGYVKQIQAEEDATKRITVFTHHLP